MKQIYTLLAGTVLLLSSCATSHKASQTPDDIYYSPSSSGKTAASGDDQDEYSSGKAQQGDYYSTAPNDQYVRMKTQDPRFSYFDDYNAYDSYYSPGLSAGLGYGYGFPSYGYGLGFGFGPSFGLGFGDPYMCWNNYFMWNSWYNPYFYNPYYGGGVIAAGSKYNTTAVYSHLRAFNGTSYRNGLVTRSTTRSNERAYRPRTSTTYYTPGVRNSYRSNQINTNRNNNYNRPSNNFNNNNNYSRPSFSQPTRSYTPSSSGGGGGFSRPSRH